MSVSFFVGLEVALQIYTTKFKWNSLVVRW